MKKNFLLFVILLVVSFGSCSFGKKLSNEDYDQKETLILDILQYLIMNDHYDAGSLNDEYSKKVYANYIEYLDGMKRYLTGEDIQEFKAYELELDDKLRALDISFFNLSYDRITKRMVQAEEMVKEIMAQEKFDFSKKETINLDYENLQFAKNHKQLRERWVKILRFSVLSNLVTKEKEEEAKKEKDSTYVVKSYQVLKGEAIENTKKSFEDMFFAIRDLNADDWFGMYLNSYLGAIDPHSNYMVPDIRERFNREMAGKFEGIGAQLQKKMDGVRITDIIMGGPVWKGKLLEVGDYILKVAQGDKEPVDIVGMRLDDAVKLIKGPKGTEVRLTVKKVDGTITVVSIIRDVIELEETFAKSALIKSKSHTYGIINLPRFYIDFENRKGRNCSSDMALEIEKLQKENAEALIIDLRNNGGGSLDMVVEIAGMFIKEGPVVQVRQGVRSQVLNDRNKSILWEKPVIILINELSASASEILAAALQDYNRAIILGSKQSYGKGTVQTMRDFNRLVQNNKFGDLGALKITTQKFYRINGGSTQLEGVKSDIVIPDKYKYIKVGEQDLNNPIVWDKISPANYSLWQPLGAFDAVIAQSNERIAANDNFKLIDENAKWIERQRNDYVYPIEYQLYKKKLEEREATTKRFKVLNDYKSSLVFVSPAQEEELVKTNEDIKTRRDRWHENLQKDMYVEEAVNVLDDLIK